jgi:hypothetical protein
MRNKIDLELGELFVKLKRRDATDLECLRSICHDYEEFREILSIRMPEVYLRTSITTGRALSNICFDLMKHPKLSHLEHATPQEVKDGHIFFLAHRGGICNRLRAIAALEAASEMVGFKFSFAWVETESCTGSPLPWKNFSNRISPIAEKPELGQIHVLLEDNPASAWQYFDRFRKSCLIESWQDFNSLYIKTSAKILKLALEKLGVLHHLEALVKANDLRNYAALHIRRTDFVSYFKNNYPGEILPPVESYMRQARLIPSENNFYLSTDDIKVRNRFQSEFGKRVVFFDFRFDQAELRQTSFTHSLLDLAMLSGASHLMLTPRSSFSDYAASISNASIIKPQMAP